MKKIPQDIVGAIAILKFPRETFWLTKKIKAYIFLKQNKNIKTVLEKTEKISGRLRTPTTKFLAGRKTKETIYRENDCIFKFNVDETYFSPRLASHRREIAEEISKLAKANSKILVMFAGVAPWPIVIGKSLKKQNKFSEIISNEINKKASVFADENIKLNKLENMIKTIQCDVKSLPKKLKDYKADFILMPRPNLKETFLKTALELSKKNTIIYYHGFGTKEKVLNEVKSKKLKVLSIKKAGDIGKYVYRWLVKFILN